MQLRDLHQLILVICGIKETSRKKGKAYIVGHDHTLGKKRQAGDTREYCHKKMTDPIEFRNEL